MDKSWVHLDRRTKAYDKGMKDFVALAFAKVGRENTIRCPCTLCTNVLFQKQIDVEFHLTKNGMDETYTRWTLHGEEEESEDGSTEEDLEQENLDDANVYGMIETMIESENLGNNSFEGDNTGGVNVSGSEQPNPGAQKFFKLLDDAKQELYPNCKKVTKLSFIIRLFQLKCLHGWSDAACDGVLELVRLLLPEGHCVPDSLYKCQKVTRDLGLKYEKFDACINDCVLFRNEYAHLDKCPTCLEPRWKPRTNNNNNEDTRSASRRKGKVAQKVLRYFPIIPRLKRLFMTEEMSINMKWHHDARINDGVLRHPADSLAWKKIDETYPSFASDPRNVRLGLATDGFNPFGAFNLKYSVWPVVLIPYNMPPWLCMKQPFFILSLIIPGPKSPGNDIDVYLQPLIEDLQKLWEHGALTYDAATKENFPLRAVVMWTINDYPALAMTSGWSTKGKLACYPCNKNTSSLRLKHGRKECYMGHRRFLRRYHPWRNSKNAFDGKTDHREPPKPLTGEEILDQYRFFEQVTFGKIPGKKKRQHETLHNWRKKSIFFELPYWETLLIHHNLDMMHVEKNVCETGFGTFCDIEGKTKDSLKARLDLKDLGIRKDLHPYKEGDKYVYAIASYTLSKEEKKLLYKFLEDVKMPDGYASNIKRCIQVEDCSISGLKTHDYHVIFQQLLPLAIRDLLPKKVSQPFIELSNYFLKLCSKELRVDELDELSREIVIILCKLEQILPPAFFTIMLHLPVHLAHEAKLAGPVIYRWMYMVERFLRTLKGYVRNKAHAEGSMEEGYMLEECMDFCSRFMKDVDTKLNRPQRNAAVPRTEPPFELGLFGSVEGIQKGCQLLSLTKEELRQAHHYILTNCDRIYPWIDKHKTELASTNQRNIEKRHREGFGEWFQNQITLLKNDHDGQATDHMISLACGPDPRVRAYSRYSINGILFRTKEAEENLNTQNSGVVVRSDASIGSIDWYGVIKKIIVLEYIGKREVVLFKCDWFEKQPKGKSSGRSYKIDEYGYADIDVSKTYYQNDPYILGNQAEQVYYVKHIKKPNWCTAVRTKPRDLYAMPTRDISATEGSSNNTDDGTVNLCRDDVERVSVDADVVASIIQETDGNEISSDSESDTDSDGLVYSDDDSALDL